ncbi:protein of unknown function DUF222 [Mycolicibacterium chubuense NBB4]|uniref:HNH nuclease domain-containing protein n=1 Tax=Mycolicibacterium chubuense (strain NBB4) TaxID=710421 RepID=I4BFA2_MYCCN|nr:HNH endonuclease signature motif containing protein [Mycolicibacterium chubuense]AFM15959.1 protein of unknown function DUF222 [Mycolicibacterium chubuense NBB4]
MFDQCYADVAIDVLAPEIERAAREEAQTSARRLAAIAELVHRTVDEDDERSRCSFDSWDLTAARVATALKISQRRASGQMRIAVALRYRLPRVAALHWLGQLSFRLVSETTWRTHLVDSDELIALIDAALAEGVVKWGPLSNARLVGQIEAVIERFDPEALRRSKDIMRTRDLHVGSCDDPSEVVAVWGRLSALDAAVLDRRLTEMANAVCDADPRSMGERRADALGALGNGSDRLTCRCGSSECPANDSMTSSVVVRVIADQAAIDAARKLIATEDAEQREKRASAREAEPATDSESATESEHEDEAEPALESAPTGCEPAAAPEPAAESEPAPESAVEPKRVNGFQPVSENGPTDSGLAVLPSKGMVPTVLLAEALRGGAKVKPVWMPGPDPEPGYRPSARLAEFIRARDMFCRFPNCDVPADRCDIDHVVPYPFGPTHPSNLNCKCRKHHLMKTFCGGSDGWRDEQRSDATVIWTAPDGCTYTTRPGSRLFFPAWDVTTADLPPPAANAPLGPDRSVLMPRRRRTRAAEEKARIKALRAQNVSPPGQSV